MSIRNLMLFTAIATSTIFLTSCEPTVMHESGCKFYAACAGDHHWVGEQLYDYVFKVQDDKAKAEHPDEMGDLVIEEGDDWWNLEVLKMEEDDYGDQVTENDLYEFILNGEMPEPNVDYGTAVGNGFLGALLGVSDQMHSKVRAFKTANKVCDENFEPLIEKIGEQVEVYDYREDKKSSSKKVTVYDVVYRIDGKRFVYCTVSDFDDEHYEINYVSDSDLYSGLGY
ncbi:MAG: hypothetical protein J6U04_02350 [Salinivirgaceae bacterium]|nr:hypothetical protein [Salinivirgaceae bacterium]